MEIAMTQVINTKLLLEEGLLNEAQAAEIMRRSRETMLALVVNIVLCGGIIAASLGFVFWIALSSRLPCAQKIKGRCL